MRTSPSQPRSHERRITAPEGCRREVKETLTHYGQSIADMKRKLTKHDLRWVRLFEHFNIPDVTEDEVDEVLNAK